MSGVRSGVWLQCSGVQGQRNLSLRTQGLEFTSPFRSENSNRCDITHMTAHHTLDTATFKHASCPLVAARD